ncbi:MAG: DUF4956 domain-containing protein [Candidatus Peribacteraceae bacterium]|nr:DUF4956 domain-containing protein [Candidatus Peribacteraceae bacterium]
MGPVVPDIGSVFYATSIDPFVAGFILFGSFILGVIIAWVYKLTHRGLSYSQSFQFALVLLTILGSVVMMISMQSLTAAIGILGAFSLIRFRTAIKDPKDTAYVLLVLSVGLSMGANMYTLAIMATGVVSIVILLLTWMNFGMTSKHESVLRILCKLKGESSTQTVSNIEATLGKLTSSYRMLSAHARAERMELSYGVCPKAKQTNASLLDALRKEEGIENAEVFDAKHQIEF